MLILYWFFYYLVAQEAFYITFSSEIWWKMFILYWFLYYLVAQEAF